MFSTNTATASQRRFHVYLLAFGTLLGSCSSAPPKPVGKSDAKAQGTAGEKAVAPGELIVLHTSDLHGQLRGSADGGGYARVAQLIQQERQKAGNQADVLAIFGGDAAGKSALPCRKTEEKACFPLLKSLGFDVAVLGNGELKRTARELNGLISLSGIPWIGTNVKATREAPQWTSDYLWTGPHTGAKIFVVSWTRAPGPGEFDPSHQNLQVRKAPAPADWKQWGARIGKNPVIWATHQDLPDDQKFLSDLCAREAAGSLRGSLALLKADNHRVSDDRSQCAPLFESGAFGENVSRLVFAKDAAGGWKLKSYELINLGPSAAESPIVKAEITAVYKKTAPEADEIVLQNPSPQTPEQVATWLASVYKNVSRADVAVVNDGAVKKGWAAGPVSREELFLALPYNNELMGLDWPVKDFERSICAATRRSRSNIEDSGSDLAFSGAHLVGAGTAGCHIEGMHGASVKLVLDSYMMKRAKRWLGKDLSGNAFRFGMNTEQALKVYFKKNGAKL